MLFLPCFALLILVILTLAISCVFDPWLALAGQDPRLVKDVSAIVLIGVLMGCFLTRAPKIRTPLPLLILIGYCIIRCYMIPTFSFPLVNRLENSIWQFRDLFYILFFFMAFVTLSNLQWRKKHIELLLETLNWLGLFTALYVFVQLAGLDSWQIAKDSADLKNTPSGTAGATLTHVTFAAAFLVLCLPGLFCRRSWLKLIIVAFAIYLCKSDMAYLATFIIVCGYFSFLCRRGAIAILSILILGGVVLGQHPIKPMEIQDNGRFAIWKLAITEVASSPFEGRENAFFLTGYGLGSYKYIFTARHTTSDDHKTIAWDKAHNEYVEWFYNTGGLGVLLLIFLIFYLLKTAFPYIIIDERALALYMIFVGSCVLAGGTFLWQLEPFRYLTVLTAAILQSRINKGEITL